MAARRKPAANHAKWNSHFWSIILFASGILVLLFAVIPGETAWLFLHKLFLGLFGAAVFLLPAILVYSAILIAMDKSSKAVAGKVIQGVILIFLLSAIIQILFVGEIYGVNFIDKLVRLYRDGTEMRGGGLFSFVLAMPLLALFQRTGATIIILVVTFVFVMLLSNVGLMEFLAIFYKPIKKMGGAIQQAHEEIPLRQQQRLEPEKKRRGQAAGEFAPPPGAKRRQELEGETGEPSQGGRKPRRRKHQAEELVLAEIDGDNRMTEIDIPIAGTGRGEETGEDGEPLPIHPVASPKITKDKLEETVKHASADLDDLIKKAVELPDKPAVRETPGAIPPPSLISGEEAGEHIPTLEQPAPDARLYQQNNEVSVYKFPAVNLLKEPALAVAGADTEQELKTNADILVDTLKSFGVATRIVDIHRGPTVTRYELQPSAGVKISKITGLADDIALNLAAAGVRIEAPIPGKAAVGIEVPNKLVDVVTFREMVDTQDFDKAESKVSFALGKDIAGNVVIADIGKMPHVLIAGSTGSGKSVCINSIIMSLLYKASPDEVRILMIDPKVVELGIYNGIPHLLIPVVTDPKKAAGALSWAVTEMLKRYKMFADSNVRDLKGYNAYAKSTEGVDPLPQIVIIIDELADLMMAAPNDVEDAICRLAQMARAAGMHLVIATQRPSVDIITGVIKANIPSRIAFAVSSQVDSRTILDSAGAEKLLGRGDMLFYPVGSPKPTRVQGCFVTDKEVETVVDFIKNSVAADYDSQIMEDIEKNAANVKSKGDSGSGSGGGDVEASDEMIEQAIECVVDAGQASTSYLQRRLKLGYARAARIMDELEQLGVIGPFEGAKPRSVLMSKEQWAERKMRNQGE